MKSRRLSLIYICSSEYVRFEMPAGTLTAFSSCVSHVSVEFRGVRKLISLVYGQKKSEEVAYRQK